MKLCATPARVLWRLLARRILVAGCACVVLVCSASLWIPAVRAQTPAEIIGNLSGDDVTVSGALSFDSNGGRSTAVLASGSEVTVRSGQARIQLTGGGEIAVCGPAHFSLLKSGGAITLALDYGRVHPMLDAAVPLTIYTPQVVATPISVGQEPRDLSVGLDQEGTMCAIAARGAVNIEQQLSGQSLLVPQGGAMSLDGGQLSAAPVDAGNCACDLMVARSIAPKQLELSVPVHPTGSHPAAAPPVTAEQPVYMVYMPPLTFDFSAPAPPPAPDPQTILLVREARLQPDVIFRGQVEPAESPAAPALQKKTKKTGKGQGFFAKLFGVFRGHTNSPSCAGVGCSQPQS